MNDAELLQRSTFGDESAFEVLYQRHRDAVYRFAYVMTKSEADAEEVVQDSFLILNRIASKFDPKRSALRTWLLGITRNVCYRRTRAEASESAAPSAALVLDLDVEATLIENEAATVIRKAVMALPNAQREAIVLFEFEGLSLAETAEVLGIEANAVKARLHRGRQILRDDRGLKALLGRNRT
jgi:RNA polymerase sigma-70 factor (ECF subfamily)